MTYIFKQCPSCYQLAPSALRVCSGCGWQFYPSKKKGAAQ